jgi:IS5 family transposase
VVFAQRPRDGRGLDRSAHHARFAGIELISDRIPDETTILSFRHLLERHDLGEQIYCFAEDFDDEIVNTHLSGRGMSLRQGTIVDATLIAAPSSTKNKEWKQDPEMHQTKKANQWYYGMEPEAREAVRPYRRG